MAQSFVNQIGNIRQILLGDRRRVFFTMLLVTANTMAQSVRERTNEIGVPKTLGSRTRVLPALSESVLLTVVGAARRRGRVVVSLQFASVFQQYLPGFGVPREAMVRAALYATGLGLLAGAAPAFEAMRLRIVEALRRD
jgi:putative ABC transport system permease protein